MENNLITVYLGLGSNMGEREANLKMALSLLSHRLRMGKVSSMYDTAPAGNTEQPRFLNLACQAYTTLPPEGLLALVKGIENMMGRRSKSGEPRPIDIDILFYDGQTVKTADLVIPHPQIEARAFVLVPLAEIAPELVHPVIRKTVKKMLQNLGEIKGVLLWSDHKEA